MELACQLRLCGRRCAGAAKGTILAITAWHDNTADSPSNPDWRQWVGWGDRTIDEMAHAWVDVTYISEEDYEKEVAKRQAKESSEQ